MDECDLKKIPRGDLKKHLDQFCTGRKRTCKFSKYGCEWFGLLRNMEDHACLFSNPIIGKALEDLETKIDSLTSENQKLKEENGTLINRVKELEERSVERAIEPTAPPSSDHTNQIMNSSSSQFNQGMPIFSSSHQQQRNTMTPPPQPGQPQMNQSMYGFMPMQSPPPPQQQMVQSMYNSYQSSYPPPTHSSQYNVPTTSLQSPSYGSMTASSLKRVRMTVTTCIWSRLPFLRGDVYLPLTDGYGNDFEFNVNEQNNGDISSYSNPQVAISGNWLSGALKLNITYPQLNRHIVVDGIVGFCTSGVTNLILNFTVKSTGLNGRGNVGDGGKIHCTLIVY